MRLTALLGLGFLVASCAPAAEAPGETDMPAAPATLSAEDIAAVQAATDDGVPTYEAIATLRMNKQPPPVRRALAKAYGWHGDHNETLSSTEVALGTPEEAEAFKQETLDRLIQARQAGAHRMSQLCYNLTELGYEISARELGI